jgi:hypothetical protein
MRFVNGEIAESSVHEGIRREGKALGLAAASAKGYVGVDTEIYADVFAKNYAEGFAEGDAEGRIDEARTTLLRLGAKKLGPSGERIEAEIATMRDVDRLNDLSDRVDDVSTWDDLLAPPGPPSWDAARRMLSPRCRCRIISYNSEEPHDSCGRPSVRLSSVNSRICP